jgi:hypothetical protein
MISFACPACNKQLKVTDEPAGKKGKCPGCGQPVVIPGKVVASPSLEERPTANKILVEQVTVPPPNLSDATNSPNPDESNQDSSLTDFLAPPQADDELGRLGGFRILKILGHGGLGVVFQGAENQQL